MNIWMKMTNSLGMVKCELELISIHILKTGGSSLASMLKDYYKETFFHYKEAEFKAKGIDFAVLDSIVPPECKVLHGHYLYSQIKNLHLTSKAKIITWLRDPVERVISRYYFLMSNLRNNPDHPLVGMKNMSLVEFAQDETFRNRISKFLKGLDLEDLYFIGFLDDFENDLARINQMLDINDYQVYHNKNNTAFKSMFVVTEGEKKVIAELNMKDIELYNAALKIKEAKIHTVWA